MWIALGILTAVIVIFLLLPVQLLLKVDENEAFGLQIRFLWLTFGGDSKVGKAVKKQTKAPKKKQPTLKERIEKDGLGKTISDTYGMLTRILKAAVSLVGRFAVKRLHIKIRCGGDNAATAAIRYGQYSALTYGLVNTLRGFLKVREKGCHIDIGCDFGGKNQFACDLKLSIRVGQALPVIIKYLWNELKIKNKKEEVK
ncbi:MAG: hypothetical protein IKA47_09940 [Oscillospiraceae bacterium]|nr:hypothetical protein [Oscillospiraceae bacterium]